MDRFDKIFQTLGHRINSLSPANNGQRDEQEPLASLIAKVDAARRLYVPGIRR